MTADTNADVAALVADAIALYRDDPVASKLLQRHALRLKEPIRVAIAGMVKAGKSTLLNAIIGEEVAPTDAGECTKIVTWYRYGDTRRVTVHPLGAPPRPIAVKRRQGRLVFELGDLRAEDVDHLVVDWPAQGLREMTLIDTPGMASLSEDVSLRSTEFLLPRDAPSEADAIIYLMRHLHAEDLSFLEAFRDASTGLETSVNTLAVLSRADEIGAGRIDALISAQRIADRYRHDGALKSLAVDVVAVAGLLAQSARSLKQAEFAALAEIAALDRPDRERLLSSAERFGQETTLVSSTPTVRASLVERFGVFGVRFSAALVRGGISRATELSKDLARRSGLHELLALIAGQFQTRAAFLKSRAALAGVEAVVRSRPRAESDGLEAAIERIQAGAHEFRELALLSTMRSTPPTLPAELAEEAQRIIGGHGVTILERLGMPADSDADAQRAQALAFLIQWRSLAREPLADRSVAEVCRVVIRSCEGMVFDLTPELDLTSDDVVGSGVRLDSEPSASAGQEADDEGGDR